MDSSRVTNTTHFDRRFAENQRKFRAEAKAFPRGVHFAAAWSVLVGLVLLLLLLSSGCAPQGYVRADAIDGTLRRVIKRHDSYTEADKELKPFNKRLNLRDTELLLKLLDEAKKEPKGE